MSKKSILLAAMLSTSLALASCGRGAQFGSNGVCTPFRPDPAAPAPSAAAADGSAAVDECLHRWGYALSQSHESADVIASATVTACGGALSNWNQQSLNQANQQPTEATSLTTGQPVDALTEHAQFAQSQALFYVVQARAGSCAGPPARMLVRTGG